MTSVFGSASDDVELPIVVWLDADDYVNDENQQTQQQQQLHAVVDCLIIFKDKTKCEKYIQSMSPQKKVTLIISGESNLEIVSRIHTLCQVTSIYIYCADKKANKRWMTDFTKVKDIIIGFNELISRIRIDQQSSLDINEVLSANIFIASGDTYHSMATFLIHFAYSHLLLSVLLQMDSIEKDQNNLIYFCKDEYEDNDIELSNILEFQADYSKDKALSWYTRDCFISKLLNGALIAENSDLIFMFQGYIRDVYEQLTKYQYQAPICVYRGQLMSTDEINVLSGCVGKFIRTKSFFSTSFDRQQSLKHTFHFANMENLHRVLFEIDADPRVATTKPFADIRPFGERSGRNEVLFSFGSIFRVLDINQSDDQVWIIRMTLYGDDHPDLKQVFEKMDKEYGYSDENSSFIAFSRVQRAMKKFDEAEKYCCRVHPRLSANDRRRSMLYDELANIGSRNDGCDVHDYRHEKLVKTGNYESTSGDNDAVAIDYKDCAIKAEHVDKKEKQKILFGDPISTIERTYYEKCKVYHRATGMPIVSISDEILADNMELTSVSIKFGVNEDYSNFNLQTFLDAFCNVLNINVNDIVMKKIQIGSIIGEAELSDIFNSSDKKIKIQMIGDLMTDELKQQLGKMKIFFFFMRTDGSFPEEINCREEIQLYPKWNRLYGIDGTYWEGALDDGKDRGNQPYYCPVGWERHSLYVAENFDEKFKGWRVCYHGTKFSHGLSILLTGLKPARDQAHGPGIYFSPSINYASYPRYSQIREIEAEYQDEFSQSGKYVQFVLECRVRPDTQVSIRSETLRAGTVIIDSNIGNSVIEWIIDIQNKHLANFNDKDASIICTGLMIRVTHKHPALLPESQWWRQTSLWKRLNNSFLGIDHDVLEKQLPKEDIRRERRHDFELLRTNQIVQKLKHFIYGSPLD